jgi:hypothetical protein
MNKLLSLIVVFVLFVAYAQSFTHYKHNFDRQFISACGEKTRDEP